MEEVNGKEAVENVIRGKSAYEMERAKSAAALEGKKVARAVAAATETPSLGGAIAPPTLNALSLKQWSHTKSNPGSKRLWSVTEKGQALQLALLNVLEGTRGVCA